MYLFPVVNRIIYMKQEEQHFSAYGL